MVGKDELQADLKESMKSRDKLRISTLRMLLSEVHNAEIAKQGELDEAELLAVVSREAKRRKESIDEFERGGRNDLVEKESAELEVLMAYLPEQLGEEEIARVVDEIIAEVGATSPSDLGKVMGALMPKVKGKADGKMVNRMVRSKLEGP